jgi:microcystin-dependent protein
MYLPTGYLPCNGAALSRTEYYLLFSVIDTFYGAGNGTTTFNVPSLSNGTGNPNTYIIRYVEQVTPCVTITPQLNVAGVGISGTESFNFS